MYFSDYAAASEAVTTEAAGAFFPAVFELATGGVRIVFAEIEAADATVSRFWPRATLAAA
jgi:hypothetical protein